MRIKQRLSGSTTFTLSLLCLLTVLLLLAACASGSDSTMTTEPEDAAAEAESTAESGGDEATMEDQAKEGEEAGAMEAESSGGEEPMAGSEPAETMMAGDAEAGAAVFKKKCSSCHGDDGSGNDKMAAMLKVTIRDLASAEAQAHDDAALGKIMNEGQGKMKPVKGLTDADVDNLIAYMRSLKE